jgi:hypothetical protein
MGSAARLVEVVLIDLVFLYECVQEPSVSVFIDRITMRKRV